MGAQSNPKRISLSSSMFAGRVKKFDSYKHDDSSSQRTPQRTTRISSITPVPVQPLKKNNLKISLSPQGPPVQKKRHPQPIHLDVGINPTKTDVRRVAAPVQKAKSPRQNYSATATVTQQLAIQAVGQSPATQKSIIADQLQDAEYDSSSTQRKPKRPKVVTAMYTAAIAVFIFASAVSVQTLLTNQQTQDVLAEKVEQSGTDSQGTGRDPSETPVSDDDIVSYQVAADMPRYISIPDINVFARVKHTGIDDQGAVDSPSNIYDVSWYNGGAKPGDAIGSSLLLGHVQGWSAPGVFKNIDKLENGARYTVEKGNGETLTYEVTRTAEYTLDSINMAQILSAEEPGEHDMKLMTCSGSFDASTDSYNSRYVVYAKIIR